MSFNLNYQLPSTPYPIDMLSKALKLTRISKQTKIRQKLEQYAKKIITNSPGLQQRVISPLHSDSISIFVVTGCQVTVLLFLLIPNELLLAFLYFFHFLHQGSHLFGVQSLYIDHHRVPNPNSLEKLYLLLCLEFLYFLCQLSQLLKLKTWHYLHLVRWEIRLNRFWKFPTHFIDWG